MRGFETKGDPALGISIEAYAEPLEVFDGGGRGCEDRRRDDVVAKAIAGGERIRQMA